MPVLQLPRGPRVGLNSDLKIVSFIDRLGWRDKIADRLGNGELEGVLNGLRGSVRVGERGLDSDGGSADASAGDEVVSVDGRRVLRGPLASITAPGPCS
jgi:hypothetical protein